MAFGFAPWFLLESRCFLCRFRQRALTSVAARCEPILAFPLLPGPPTCPAWPSAASTSAGCEPFLANSLPPGPPTCPAWLSPASVSARCEPFSAFPLLPGPPTCPTWLSAASTSSRCEPVPAFPLLPGPSTHPAWPFAASASAGCEPFSAFPLPPGPPTCPAWLSAASTSSGCEPFSPNRLTPASCGSGSGPGTMAAGVREQAASCDAFVLSRRPPAPGAPPSRTFPLCLIAKSFPEPSPTLAEPRPGPWPGLPLRIPSGSVKGAPSRGRSGRGRCDRRGLAGWVGHEHTA